MATSCPLSLQSPLFEGQPCSLSTVVIRVQHHERCLPSRCAAWTRFFHSLGLRFLVFQRDVVILISPASGGDEPGAWSSVGTIVLCVLSHFSRVRLFAAPWTAARHAPLSMGLSRQEYWSGLLCPPAEDLPDPGIKPVSPTLQMDSLPTEPPGKLGEVQITP